MIRFLVCTLALALGGTGSSYADGDPDAGKAKAAVCAACHGVDGNSINPEWPSLSGQHPSYIVQQLKAYKSGDRANVLMSPMSMSLSEQDQKDLAAYYATQTLTGKTADPDAIALGEKIYRGGNVATGVSACAACHGPDGRGNPGAMMPRVAGQHATYLSNQLKLYAAGERQSDMEQMMRNVAARMSDAEIAAVASYMQGLR
ncbi:MAG: cytochrome c4 [Gammaproteobacteria bacterium]|nr:cytochrome c4 [Gammaproteobacteria bacterium]